MRIALTQMDIIWEAKEANLQKGERLVQKAKEEGAQMLIFPEMSFTGFSMNLKVTAEDAVREEGSFLTPTAAAVREWSRCYGLAIVFGYVIKRGNKGVNCLMAVENGKICGYYEKLHPFSYGEEGRHFAAGNKLCQCCLGGMTFGMFICYDLRFPEIFQVISKKAAAAVVIANWPLERLTHWRALLQARAIENQCYMLGVNRTGHGGGLEYVRSSLCFDPYGREVKGRIAALDGDSLVLVEVYQETALQYRKDFPLKQDRRETLYKKLLSDEL